MLVRRGFCIMHLYRGESVAEVTNNLRGLCLGYIKGGMLYQHRKGIGSLPKWLGIGYIAR